MRVASKRAQCVRKHESKWKWFTVVSTLGKALCSVCTSASMGQVKKRRIWYRKFGLAHSDTLCDLQSPHTAAYRLALFSFSARWLFRFLALSRYIVGFYCIHDSFPFFVGNGGWRRTNSNTHTHTHTTQRHIFPQPKFALHVEIARIHRVKYLLLRFIVLCLFAFYFSFRLFLLDFRGSFIWHIQLLVLFVHVNQPPDRYFIHSFWRNDNNSNRLIVFTYLPFFGIPQNFRLRLRSHFRFQCGKMDTLLYTECGHRTMLVDFTWKMHPIVNWEVLYQTNEPKCGAQNSTKCNATMILASLPVAIKFSNVIAKSNKVKYREFSTEPDGIGVHENHRDVFCVAQTKWMGRATLLQINN